MNAIPVIDLTAIPNPFCPITGQNITDEASHAMLLGMSAAEPSDLGTDPDDEDLMRIRDLWVTTIGDGEPCDDVERFITFVNKPEVRKLLPDCEMVIVKHHLYAVGCSLSPDVYLALSEWEPE